MRFTALFALLPLALAAGPVISRTPTADSASANVEARAPAGAGAEGDLESRTFWLKPKCKNFSTRTKDCKCRPGLVEPSHHKRTGNHGGGRNDWWNPKKPEDNCQCDDVKNSMPYKEHGILKCKCPGTDQFYDYNKAQCDCKTSCIEIRKKDKLECKPKGPQHPKPSHKPGHHHRRTLKAALAERKTDLASRAVEDTLGCKPSEKACEKHQAWSCVDIMSSLQTCGGCADEAVDCGSLPGVNEVRCAFGQCVIDSCAHGFQLSKNDTAASAGCEPVRRSGFFSVQE